MSEYLHSSFGGVSFAPSVISRVLSLLWVDAGEEGVLCDVAEICFSLGSGLSSVTTLSSFVLSTRAGLQHGGSPVMPSCLYWGGFLVCLTYLWYKDPVECLWSVSLVTEYFQLESLSVIGSAAVFVAGVVVVSPVIVISGRCPVDVVPVSVVVRAFGWCNGEFVLVFCLLVSGLVCVLSVSQVWSCCVSSSVVGVGE